MAQAKRKLAAILSADVAGYSALMGDDERATVATLDECRAVFGDHVAGQGGRIVINCVLIGKEALIRSVATQVQKAMSESSR